LFWYQFHFILLHNLQNDLIMKYAFSNQYLGFEQISFLADVLESIEDYV